MNYNLFDTMNADVDDEINNLAHFFKNVASIFKNSNFSINFFSSMNNFIVKKHIDG